MIAVFALAVYAQIAAQKVDLTKIQKPLIFGIGGKR